MTETRTVYHAARELWTARETWLAIVGLAVGAALAIYLGQVLGWVVGVLTVVSVKDVVFPDD